MPEKYTTLKILGTERVACFPFSTIHFVFGNMQTSQEHFTTMADAKFDGEGENRVSYGELENRESPHQ